MDIKLLNVIVSQFNIDISNAMFKPITQGYINDTFIVEENAKAKYVLQRINSNVFNNVPGLHRNMKTVLKKLKASDYSELKLVKTKADQVYFEHDDSFWRLMSFIPNGVAYNYTSNTKIAFEAGRLIGKFHQLLKDENVTNYEVTLPNLNYLPFRITEFQEALKNTSTSLKLNANLDIEFAKTHLSYFENFYKAKLPKRICHNDTKLNNLLFDNNDTGLCLIDLDTIQEGYFHYDFGDLVRTVVSETNEDEKNLLKIKFNISLFKKLAEGVANSDTSLSKQEIKLLPISCALMPFMHGLRALTDYLNGNIYYKVSYPEQNLDRCRSLFQFTKLALKKQYEIKKIIDSTLY